MSRFDDDVSPAGHVAELIRVLPSLDVDRLSRWGTALAGTFAAGGRLLVAGNGGSAAALGFFLSPAFAVALSATPAGPIMNRIDEIASAASILMGQTDAARPVGRGNPFTVDEDISLARLLVGPSLPEFDFDLQPTSDLASLRVGSRARAAAPRPPMRSVHGVGLCRRHECT